VLSLLFGLVIALPLGEGLARLAFDPMDYLLPERVPDDRLGFRVASYSGHHDAWGFRNRGVPEQVDIVTIGDLQTYGWASRWRGAWPTRLEERGGVSVYNMAMGGFGPGQYLTLMEHYVPRRRVWARGTHKNGEGLGPVLSRRQVVPLVTTEPPGPARRHQPEPRVCCGLT